MHGGKSMTLPALKTAVPNSCIPWHYNESSKPGFNTMTSLTRKKNQNKITAKKKKQTKPHQTKKTHKKPHQKLEKKIPNAHTSTYNSYNIRDLFTNIFLAH